MQRSEISKKNKYYVEKHRYYELKHFCLQYPIWVKSYNALDSLSRNDIGLEHFNKVGSGSSPVERCVIAMERYGKWIDLVETAASNTDDIIGQYILKAVTENRSYEYLRVNTGIPCCRECYYELYRKFFYILNKSRS